MSEEMPDVNDALNEYFRLKSKFENETNSHKRKIINNPALSKREKRAEYLKLVPKCVNCKRPSKIGTLFSTTYLPHNHKNDPCRLLTARCGNVVDPCNLHIAIQLNSADSLENIIRIIQKEITDSKNLIINDKNRLLFGLITTETALENFDNNKTYVNDLTTLYETYVDIWNKKIDNPQKQTELDESLVLFYENIDKIKECIQKMNDTDDRQFAVDAAHIYYTTIEPLSKKIRQLKYGENMVYNDDSTNAYRLIQSKSSLGDLIVGTDDDKVIYYDVGFNPKKTSKKKALIIEDTSSELDVNELTIKIKPTIEEDEPIIGEGKDGIAWNNSKYQELWDKLPEQLKTEFKLNIDWMKEFMHKCVNDKENDKNRVNKRDQFRNQPTPSNIIIPPKMENGKYDFNVELYNEVFNELPKSKQEMYLQLNREKLIYNLKNLIEQKFFQSTWSGCRLTSPPNLVIPPRKMSNGQYDFGVSIYNKVFNRLSESLKNTYLSFYKEDPVTKEKNYNMLIDSMNTLVEKEVNFGRGFF
jgi:hypothetical protein